MLKCSGKRTRKNFRLPCLNSSPRVMAGDLSLNKETQYVLHDRSVFCAPRSLRVLCPGIAPCSVPHDHLVFCAPRLLRVLCPGIALCSVPRNRSMFYAAGLLSCSGLQAAEGKQCLFLFPDLCSFYVKLIVENPFFPGASELLSTRYKDKEEIFLFPRLGTAGATC